MFDDSGTELMVSAVLVGVKVAVMLFNDLGDNGQVLQLAPNKINNKKTACIAFLAHNFPMTINKLLMRNPVY